MTITNVNAVESRLQLAHPPGCRISHREQNAHLFPEQAEAWTPATRPPVTPRRRRISSSDTQEKIANARLRELFWNVEASALLDEAEQRIAAVLCKALSPETVQVFDDLYENPAC